jgi:hypothetical protein
MPKRLWTTSSREQRKSMDLTSMDLQIRTRANQLRSRIADSSISMKRASHVKISTRLLRTTSTPTTRISTTKRRRIDRDSFADKSGKSRISSKTRKRMTSSQNQPGPSPSKSHFSPPNQQPILR